MFLLNIFFTDYHEIRPQLIAGANLLLVLVQMTSFTTASLYKYSNILLIGSFKGVSEWFKQTGIYLTSF